MRQSDGKEVDASRLGDLLELVIDYRGKTPKKLGGDFAESGVPVISAIHIKNGRIAWEERERFVTQEMFKKWMKDPLKKGDVLLTSEAPLGEVALVPNDDDLVLSQRLFAMRPNPQLLDATYLMYFLKSPIGQRELSDRATGSTVVGIRQAELVDILISYPSPSRQRFIGEVLSNLDFKIDKNQELSKSLELIAWTVFKSWFIHFDPVKAKMAGEAPVGMDAETAALFPDSMEESELGEIPTGWQLLDFDYWAQIISGGTPKTSTSSYWNGNIPWFSVADAPSQGGVFFVKTAKRISEEGLQHSAANLVRPGVTILSARGTVGKVAMVAKPATFNQSCFGFEGKWGDAFNYLMVKGQVARLQGLAHGGMFDTITRETFKSLVFPFAGPEILEVFNKVADPIFELIKNLQFENERLRAVRDSLLPRLISGELEIPEEMLAA